MAEALTDSERVAVAQRAAVAVLSQGSTQIAALRARAVGLRFEAGPGSLGRWRAALVEASDEIEDMERALLVAEQGLLTAANRLVESGRTGGEVVASVMHLAIAHLAATRDFVEEAMELAERGLAEAQAGTAEAPTGAPPQLGAASVELLEDLDRLETEVAAAAAGIDQLAAALTGPYGSPG